MAITKIGTPELFDFSATNTALQLPTGDTASRPATPSTGEWRFNSQLKYVEYYDGGAWRQIDTESAAVFKPSENFNTNTYFGTGATQAIDAKFNEAANFNGTSSVISIPLNVVSVSSAYTLSLWFNAVDVSANTGIFTNIGSSEIIGQIGINILSSTQINLYSITTNNSNTVDSLAATVPTMSNNTWYNLVVVADRSLSNRGKIYLNGVEASSYTFNASAGSNARYSTAQIGRSDNRFTKGKIDQVRIFNTALTLAQAEDCFTDETTTTAATLNFPAGAGCIAAYQLDGNGNDISGTYNGTTTDIGYTGLEFLPDLVWIKVRNQDNNHVLTDSVRGVDSILSTDGTNPTSTFDLNWRNQYGQIQSFDTNGFTIKNSTDSNVFNKSGDTYVAWNWKAAGAPTATNSAGAGNVPTAGSVKIDGADSTTALAGSIAATKISANTAAGFSIVSYTGNATNSTIGHGLGILPKLIIFKNTNATTQWDVYAAAIGATKRLQLSTPGIASTTSTPFNNTDPTTSVFNVGIDLHTNGNNNNIIAYCFADKPGYQKVGEYTGDANSLQTIVTGFPVRFVLIKAYDNTTNWEIFDSTRGGNKGLQPNVSSAEFSSGSNFVSFLLNGFEVSSINHENTDGKNYIYLAIA